MILLYSIGVMINIFLCNLIWYSESFNRYSCRCRRVIEICLGMELRRVFKPIDFQDPTCTNSNQILVLTILLGGICFFT